MRNNTDLSRNSVHDGNAMDFPGKIYRISDSILRPRLKRTSIIAAIPVIIFLIDLLSGYCTEDMCFSGIHRISGDQYYFLFANIEFFIIKAMLGFVVISLIYGGIMHLIRISRKKLTRKH